MTLPEIGGRLARPRGIYFWPPGALGRPLCAVVEFSKHTPAEDLTRRWAVGPANYDGKAEAFVALWRFVGVALSHWC